MQWINGSFISTKINPRDIDLVNLIDYKLVSTYETELKRFTTSLGKEEYGVDGYIVKVYPEEHKEYTRMESTLIYWQNWFSTSRRNRSKKAFSKRICRIGSPKRLNYNPRAMEELISGKAAKILDLLEQIESVNEMISLHENDVFMKEQFVYRKEEFIKELANQLAAYKIAPEDLAA